MRFAGAKLKGVTTQSFASWRFKLSKSFLSVAQREVSLHREDILFTSYMIYKQFPDQEKYEKSMLFFVREGFQLTKEGFLLPPKSKEVMRYLRKADCGVEQAPNGSNAKVLSKQIKKNHKKIMEKRHGKGEVKVSYKLIWEEDHILRKNFNRKGILKQQLPDSVSLQQLRGRKLFPSTYPPMSISKGMKPTLTQQRPQGPQRNVKYQRSFRFRKPQNLMSLI